jgi:GH24 family phage-related lysozyme (muramidase)
MAQRRVPVERMRTTTSLQAVASPVETYVRPAEIQTNNELANFVNAITPAMKTLADVKRQEQLKLQREAEQGIASARALDATLGLRKIERELNQDYVDNQDFYLTATDEEVAERRQELSNPLLEKARASGDDLLFTALQGDLEVSNLKFFTETLDPARQLTTQNEVLSQLGTEVFAIGSSVDRNNPEAMATAVKQIDDLVNATQKATGLPYSQINSHIYTQFYLPSSTSEGRNGLYAWLESKKIPTTGENLPQLGTLNSRLAAYDKAIADQNAIGQYESILAQNVKTYISNERTNYKDLQIEETVTLADGSTKKISKSDIEDAMWMNFLNEWDSYSQQLQSLPPSARDGIQKVSVNEAYRTFADAGLVPPPMRNSLQSGANILTSPTNLTNPADAERASKALAAYIQAEAYGITIPDTVLSKEQKDRFMVAEVLLNEVGKDETTSLIAASNADLSLLNVRINEADAVKILNTDIFSEDLGDVSNIQQMRMRVKELAGVLLSTDQMTVQQAIDKAVKIVEQDTKIISTTNGNRIGIELKNTGITRRGGEEVNIEQNLLLASELPEIKKMMQYYGGTGLSVSNSSNDNLLTLSIVDTDGSTTQTLGYVSIDDFSSKDRLVELILAGKQNLIDAGDYDPEAPTNITVSVPLAALSMGQQLEQMLPEAVDTLRNQFPDGSAMDLMLKAVQNGENVVFDPPIADIPQDMMVETITPLTGVNGQETPFFLYAGRLANGDVAYYKSIMTPDTYQQKYEGKTVNVTEPMPSDVGVAEAPAPSMTDIQQGNVTTFSTERERQQRDPYKDIPQEPTTMQDVLDLTDKAISDNEQSQAIVDLVDSVVNETPSEIPSEAPEGKQIESFDMIEGETTGDKVINLLKEHEGFSATPYTDGNAQSVGYGFYLPSLTSDEKALIKDVNNVTKEEAEAVLKLKVSKIQDFLTEQLPMFDTLNGEQQSSIISMAYQLGSENIVKKFPTFFSNLKKATETAQGTAERMQYLTTAANNMLYNYNKDGEVVSETLWNKQTPNRAKAMADNLLKEDFGYAPTAFESEGERLARERYPAADNIEDIEVIKKRVEEQGATDPLTILPSNIRQFVSNIVTGDSTVSEKDLDVSDLDLLRTIVSTKLANNDMTLKYEDYGEQGGTVLSKGGLDTLQLSFESPAFRMATLLGQASIEVEDGKVYIVDTYDFNVGAKGQKFAKDVAEGNVANVLGTLGDPNTPMLERIRIAAYVLQPSEAKEKGVRIYLGTTEELS